MEYWELSDEELLKQCDWYAGRASGRGGQKRNKTHSAIRITHKPTGVSAIANEHRLQGENRTLAMKRLRHMLMLEVRREIDIEHYEPPAEVKEQMTRKERLAVNPENPRYLTIAAAILDLLQAYRGQVAKAADHLGVTTTNFVNVIHRDPKLWTAAQEMRKRFNLPLLKP